MTARVATRLFVAATLLTAAVVGCAPYRMGVKSLYSCNIRTVYVPMFESNSYRRGLGERLTEAVVREIERRTPYKVVNSSDADSILTGRILTETKGVSIEAPTDDAREILTYYTIETTWVDRNGVAVQAMQPVPLPPDIVQVFSTENFFPELGESISTAQQDAINRVARQVVGLMETPW
ncbi:MAG: LptE family protein [Pirellulales bacterium]